MSGTHGNDEYTHHVGMYTVCYAITQ